MHIRSSILFAFPLLFTACQEPAGVACEDGTVERDGECVPASAQLRLTHLDVRYDLSKPVFVNNRVPITFGITAENLEPGDTEPRNVAVAFSFVEADPVDPDNPLSCGSSAIDVEVPGDGSEVLVDAFIWPTSMCASLAGEDAEVNLQVEFDGGPELAAELGVDLDAPSVTLSEAQRDEPLNQLCRASLEGDPGLGCVYAINLQPTPRDGGESLIDVRYGLSLASSVAVVPFESTEDIGDDGPADRDASLVVQSSFVINGRDPYMAAVDPALIPEDLLDDIPTLEEDLKFGLDDEALAALSQLPGDASVSYSLYAAADPDTPMPLSIRDPADANGRLAEAPVEDVVPGLPNLVVHDLFIEGETLDAVSPGGMWEGESDFVVRGCLNADFPQQGNEGDAGVDDCRELEVMLVHETPSSSGASSRSFNKSFSRSLGNSRIRVESSMSTQNRLDQSGASSQNEAEVAVRGRIGRNFNLSIVKAFANASLNIDPSQTGIDIGLEFFNQSVFSFSEQAGSIVYSDEFSISKSVDIGNLGFGFGPARIGINIAVGGSIGIGTEDTLEVLSDPDTCDELLNADEAVDLCGRMSRVVSPNFALTANIEGGLNLRLVRAGVAANLRILDTSFPLDTTLAWGLTEDKELMVRGSATWDMNLVPISGRVFIIGRVGFRRFARTLRVNLFRFSAPTLSTRLLSKSMAVSEKLQ